MLFAGIFFMAYIGLALMIGLLYLYKDEMKKKEEMKLIRNG